MNQLAPIAASHTPGLIAASSLARKICNHAFGSTGLAVDVKNGGTLENATLRLVPLDWSS